MSALTLSLSRRELRKRYILAYLPRTRTAGDIKALVRSMDDKGYLAPLSEGDGIFLVERYLAAMPTPQLR
jgi:hypothetical protein